MPQQPQYGVPIFSPKDYQDPTMFRVTSWHNEIMRRLLQLAGKLGAFQFGSDFSVKGKMSLTLGNYADDTAAKAAGLAAGDLYQTAGAVKVVQ